MSSLNGKKRLRCERKAKKARSTKTLRASRAEYSARKAPAVVLREERTTYRVKGGPVSTHQFKTIDLFCGAGGITEGFRRAGFTCLYANDINHWAIETFRANHPTTHADNRPIEKVDAAALRRELNLERGALDVIVGGPPCQGFSI